MPQYGDSNYWENRYQYQKDILFDWLEDYDSLKQYLVHLIDNNVSNVLVLGCGNSELSEKLFSDYPHLNIYNIDISLNLIKNMQEKYKSIPQLKWDVMDAKNLRFSPNTFDLVIDKCTTDALLCADNPCLNFAIAAKEVQRVLKPKGLYVIVSHGNPDTRLPLLKKEHLSFDINHSPIKGIVKSRQNEGETCSDELFKQNYIYICSKTEDADKICEENLSRVITDLEKMEALEEEGDCCI